MSEHRKGVHAARCFLVPCYNMLSFPNILITVANSLLSSTVSICKQLFLLAHLINLNTTTPPFLHRLTRRSALFQ